MNRRALTIVLAVLLCLAALTTVSMQRAQLAALRAEQSRLLAESATPSADLAHASAAEITTAPLAAPAPAVSSELLRLRSEVTRLTRQRAELGSAVIENQRLRAQAANHATNTATGIALPPGYVRASQARMAGYNTPEDAMETMLWAMHNHDLTNLLQGFTPDMAREIQAQAARESGSFFRDADAFPGLSIVSREQMPDGTISVNAEIAPGMPFGPIRFRQINGQWKMEVDRGGRR